MPIDFAKGIATTVVNQGLRKVAGNLPGMLGQVRGKEGIRDTSDFAEITNAKTSGVSPKLLQFPSNIDSDPGVGNHGHYIIFFINEFNKTKLKFSDQIDGVERGKQAEEDAKTQMSIPDKTKETKTVAGQPQTFTESELKKQGVNYGRAYTGDRRKNFRKMEIKQNVAADDMIIQKKQGYGYSQLNHNHAPSADKTKNSSETGADPSEKTTQITEAVQGKMKDNVRVEMPGRKRLDTAIALYMPAQVQVSYGAKYADKEISALAGALGQAVGDMSQGATLSDTYNKVIPMVTEGLQKKALLMGADLLDGLGISGAREAIEIGRAEVIADRMQLAFQGVDRRTFSYTFKMIPRDSREADEIKKIVHAFKFNMMPEFTDSTKRDTLNYPATFDIEYHYRGKNNTYLNRVSECFLEKMDVSYGGDRYKTFDPHNSEGAPPVETSISLTFQEIEIMTREKIVEGF